MALGLLSGVAYAMLNPPAFTSTALVVLPKSVPSIATQVVIAGSDPVLSGALPGISPALSLETLRGEVKVKSLTSFVISVSARSTNAAEAPVIANAVARSYITYVHAKSSPFGSVPAQMFEKATIATAASPLKEFLTAGIAGVLAGALIGAIVSLAVSRGDRRLRERDEIANSIGIPVLASIQVGHPSDPEGWVRLLENYEPGAVHAWQLRKALQRLGMPGDTHINGNDRGGSSVVVMSLSSDPRALALGPQLAVFSASLRIPTALVIGPQQDANAVATLRTACAVPPPASSKRPAHLRVIVSDDGNVDGGPFNGLIVFVSVVDSQTPQLPMTIHATATVIGVTAGAATAEQLARVAVSAAADGHEITGILVADPELSDHTTGLIPQLAQPIRRRMPTRLKGVMTEIKL
jgi:capsular polysaccharide biosynthesis protein